MEHKKGLDTVFPLWKKKGKNISGMCFLSGGFQNAGNQMEVLNQIHFNLEMG